MEEELKEKYMEFQLLRQQAEQHNHVIEELTEKLATLMSTKQAIDELSEVKPGTDTFVPVAQGIYVEASLKESKNFLVAIGGHAAAKKNVSQVQEILDKQITDAEQTHIQLQQNVNKIHQRLHALMKELQQADVQES